MTRVLLTNDDGYAAEGLSALRTALLGAGFAVTTVAPDGNRSGAARHVSCRGTVDVARVGGSDDDPVFACSGSPVDCVRVGLFAEGFPDVAAVVSGINHGVNLGDDATYSGTVGAALEAAMHGYLGVAFSQQDTSGDVSMVSRAPHRFGLAAWAPGFVRRALEDAPDGRVALSVNFPAGVDDPAAVATRLARVTYAPRWMRAVAERGGARAYPAYLPPDGPPPTFEEQPGTDVDAVRRGLISVTALLADLGGRSPSARSVPGL